MLFRQSAPFVEVLITLQKDASNNRQTERTPMKSFRYGSEDPLITKFPKPPKDNEKHKNKYVLIKKVIVHATTAKITVNKRYMHLWHLCLVIMNVQVEILVTVCN